MIIIYSMIEQKIIGASFYLIYLLNIGSVKKHFSLIFITFIRTIPSGPHIPKFDCFYAINMYYGIVFEKNSFIIVYKQSLYNNI